MKNFYFSEEERRLIAADLYEAEKSNKPIDTLTSRYPEITLDDAYDIQKFGLDMRLADGARIVGRKIGITSRGMMQMLNCDSPDYGYLLDTMMLLEGSACHTDELNSPRLEGEIAFIMGEDICGPAVTPANIMNATAYIVPCLELCDLRYNSWKITVRDTISDNAGAARYIIGGAPKKISEVNLRNIGMVFEKNGDLISSAAGVEVMGNPINAMTWLVNKLAEYGDGLKKGDIVLSGSFVAAAECRKGDSFALSVDGFPTLSLRFD